MSLIETIRAAKAKKIQSVREIYVSSLRSGRADAIAESAHAAGVSDEQLAADVSVLERAKELGAQASKLPALRAAAAKAKRTLDDAVKALDDAVAKLQPAVDAASWETQQADAAERAARGTVEAILGMYRDHPDLLLLADAPAPVKQRWAEDAKEQAVSGPKLEAQSRFHRATNLLRDARMNHNTLLTGPWNDQSHAASLAAVERAESAFAAARRVAIEAGISAADLDGAVGHSLPELIRN